MSVVQINREKDLNNECLHCGKGRADYCEKCYQELIGQNAMLQFKNDIREQRIKAKKEGANHDRTN